MGNHDGLAETILLVWSVIGLAMLAMLGLLVLTVRFIRQAREGKPGARQWCARLAVADLVLAAIAAFLFMAKFVPLAQPFLLSFGVAFAVVGRKAWRATAKE